MVIQTFLLRLNLRVAGIVVDRFGDNSQPELANVAGPDNRYP
jgi:hypothetical protein